MEDTTAVVIVIAAIALTGLFLFFATSRPVVTSTHLERGEDGLITDIRESTVFA